MAVLSVAILVPDGGTVRRLMVKGSGLWSQNIGKFLRTIWCILQYVYDFGDKNNESIHHLELKWRPLVYFIYRYLGLILIGENGCETVKGTTLDSFYRAMH